MVELAPSRQAALGSIPNTAGEHHPSTPVKFSCNWVCFTFPSYSGSPTRLSPSPTEGGSGAVSWDRQSECMSVSPLSKQLSPELFEA